LGKEHELSWGMTLQDLHCLRLNLVAILRVSQYETTEYLMDYSIFIEASLL